MKANFDIMMRHFHGNDKDRLAEIVRERMRHHADVDNDSENIKRLRFMEAKRRVAAVNKIKVWYIDTKSQRVFKQFIKAVKSLKVRKKQKEKVKALIE